MEPKPNGTWKMCVHYTDLNKACPMDTFPFPKLDRLVDSMVGHGLLNFMDCYFGFHEIPVWLDDQDKTSIIKEKVLYDWMMIPFGLKNIPTTFHRLINSIFLA